MAKLVLRVTESEKYTDCSKTDTAEYFSSHLLPWIQLRTRMYTVHVPGGQLFIVKTENPCVFFFFFRCQKLCKIGVGMF